ncbi:MAG TPA: polysaccharide biosynthesis C-terminal domain-containing protein [bacterium]|nr:polysaccharide biosynthesis C-terminal domain-containing protein [bacterium]
MAHDSFFRQSVLNLSAQVVLAGVTLLSLLLLARWLGPAGNGAFNLAVLTATLLLQFGNLGLGASTIYFASNRRFPLETVAGTALAFGGAWLLLAATVVGVALPYGTLEALADTLGLTPGSLATAIMAAPFLIQTLLCSGIALGLGRVLAYNAVYVTRAVLLILLATALLIGGRLDAGRAVTAYSAAALTGAIHALWLVRIKGKRWQVSLPFFRAAIGYGLKAYVGSFAQFLSYRVNVFIVAHFMGVESVGYYAVALVAAEGLWLVGGSVGQILFPRIAALGGAEGSDLSARVTRAVLAGVIVLSLGVAVLASPLIRLLFGPSYLPATPALLWLLPGVVLLSIPKVLSNDLAGRGHPEMGAASAVVSLIVSLPLNFLLIPRWGLVGAAFASSAGYAAATGMILADFHRLTGVRWIDALVITADDLRLYGRMAARLLRPSGHP